jgi:hypothetical protein
VIVWAVGGHAQNQIKYGLQQSPFAGLCSEIYYSYHFSVLLDRVSGSRLYQVPRAVEQRIVSDLMAYIPYWSSSCMFQGPDEWLGDTDVVMESLRRATSEPMLAANLVTGARVAVNCFKYHALHTWTMDHRSEVIFSFFYWLLHMFTSYLCSLTPMHCLAKRDKWLTGGLKSKSLHQGLCCFFYLLDTNLWFLLLYLLTSFCRFWIFWQNAVSLQIKVHGLHMQL